MFFKGFWLQRPLKKASRGPRWLPKGTQNIQDPKNRNPKLRPKIIKNDWNQFWSQLWKPKHSKINQKKNRFWDTLPPHLRDPNNAPPKNKREVWKNLLDWNYTLQKKGRDSFRDPPPFERYPQQQQQQQKQKQQQQQLTRSVLHGITTCCCVGLCHGTRRRQS